MRTIYKKVRQAWSTCLLCSISLVVLLSGCQSPAPYTASADTVAMQLQQRALGYEAVDNALNSILETGLPTRWYTVNDTRVMLDAKYTSAAGLICRKFRAQGKQTQTACNMDSSWRLLPPINQQQ